MTINSCRLNAGWLSVDFRSAHSKHFSPMGLHNMLRWWQAEDQRYNDRLIQPEQFAKRIFRPFSFANCLKYCRQLQSKKLSDSMYLLNFRFEISVQRQIICFWYSHHLKNYFEEVSDTSLYRNRFSRGLVWVLKKEIYPRSADFGSTFFVQHLSRQWLFRVIIP